MAMAKALHYFRLKLQLFMTLQEKAIVIQHLNTSNGLRMPRFTKIAKLAQILQFICCCCLVLSIEGSCIWQVPSACWWCEKSSIQTASPEVTSDFYRGYSTFIFTHYRIIVPSLQFLEPTAPRYPRQWNSLYWVLCLFPGKLWKGSRPRTLVFISRH